MKVLRILFCCFILVLAGCNGATPQTETFGETDDIDTWALTSYVDQYNLSSEPATFNVSVGIRTPFQGELQGVALQFRDSEGTILQQHPVGDLGEMGDRRWVNTSVSSSVESIVPVIENADTPAEWSGYVEATRIRNDGLLEGYHITDEANYTLER